MLRSRSRDQVVANLSHQQRSAMGRRGFSATTTVLGLICVMYAITYIDRVNVSTAASIFQKELHFTSVQVGLVFSAFAYPYLVFQIIGGWVSDRLVHD